jgi:alginate production protein
MAAIGGMRRTVIAAVLASAIPLSALAQFELPKSAGDGPSSVPVQQATRLSFAYSYGMESPFTYRRDNDFDSGVRDNSFVFKTKVFGSIIYRPTDWLTTTLEMKLGREYPIREENEIQLPNGDLKIAQKREPTLLVEQAIVTVRNVIAPFEINVGRRNYEDERHWLFDGSIDVASLSYRHENVRAEAMIGRDVLWSMDLLRHAKKQPTEMMMLYGDYRGFDNSVVGGYLMRRNDLSGKEGKLIMFGLRASGKPTAAFSYWSEFALLRGSDESGNKFKASAFEVGGTYRFADLPFDPNVTLAYAYGSGDGNPDDGVNNEFRQTGLQSNEARYIGLAKFKTYGEMIDPELSNLKILTLGLGARATPGISVDLAYHRYQLNAIASEIRNWGLTAQMNTLSTAQSKDVGQELDLVVGFRGLFGVRRLGLDLRAGKFFPGQAFRRSDGADGVRGANPGVSVVAKFRY